jgi:hypothetical protein
MVMPSYWADVRPLENGRFEVSWPQFPGIPAHIEAPDAEEALRRSAPHLAARVIAELQAKAP